MEEFEHSASMTVWSWLTNNKDVLEFTRCSFIFSMRSSVEVNRGEARREEGYEADSRRVQERPVGAPPIDVNSSVQKESYLEHFNHGIGLGNGRFCFHTKTQIFGHIEVGIQQSILSDKTDATVSGWHPCCLICEDFPMQCDVGLLRLEYARNGIQKGSFSTSRRSGDPNVGCRRTPINIELKSRRKLVPELYDERGLHRWSPVS